MNGSFNGSDAIAGYMSVPGPILPKKAVFDSFANAVLEYPLRYRYACATLYNCKGTFISFKTKYQTSWMVDRIQFSKCVWQLPSLLYLVSSPRNHSHSESCLHL